MSKVEGSALFVWALLRSWALRRHLCGGEIKVQAKFKEQASRARAVQAKLSLSTSASTKRGHAIAFSDAVSRFFFEKKRCLTSGECRTGTTAVRFESARNQPGDMKSVEDFGGSTASNYGDNPLHIHSKTGAYANNNQHSSVAPDLFRSVAI